MKKRVSILVTILVLFSCTSEAQELLTMKTESSRERPIISEDNEKKAKVFEFKAYSMDSYLNEVSAETAGSHPFGEIIAKKNYLLDEKYTSEVALTPGNPASKTVIKKPVIYESVKRIERDLKKSVRKGEISLNKASGEFNIILDVALSIVNADTGMFENAIKSAGDTNSIIELFTKRVILNY
jgi:hypothetical protein